MCAYAMEAELKRLEGIAANYQEDAQYTKQYFTIGRQAHVRSTQAFGTPTLIWHIAFWPRRDADPHSLPDNSTSRDGARHSYNARRDTLKDDLNKLLLQLQMRGRPQSGRPAEQFQTHRPSDWESNSKQTPVNAFLTESITFTIWWSDRMGRWPCEADPPVEDIRVRVQADVHPDFATITFFIDAGKSWNTPAYLIGKEPAQVGVPPSAGQGPSASDLKEFVNEDTAAAGEAVPGERRKKIFHAARLIQTIGRQRLDQDPSGHKYDIVPEHNMPAGSPTQLLWASNLLYEKIWKDFCDEFGCGLEHTAGKTDKVFANFRGLVLEAPEPPADATKAPLSRFCARDDLANSYPNALVKAYWPFIRRTRSEADHRDWIASGVFDWRALYITALGGQSDFDPGDEARIVDLKNPGAAPDKAAAAIIAKHAPNMTALERLDADMRINNDIEEGYLPRRKLHEGPSTLSALKELDRLPPSRDPGIKGRMRELKKTLEDIPRTVQGDQPAPFRYLFLTCGKPHRRQVGRMVDRVNLLGTLRLYAMKNFTVIRDADVHVRIYGQLLDNVMRDATERSNAFHRCWWTRECARLDAAFAKLAQLGKALQQGDPLREFLKKLDHYREQLQKQEEQLTDARREWVKAQVARKRQDRKFGTETPDPAPPEAPYYEKFYMRCAGLLSDILDRDQKDKANKDKAGKSVPPTSDPRQPFCAETTSERDVLRKAKSRRDEELALINRETDSRLMRIKTFIDELGQDAIGGLPYRINRAHYYAEIYRRMIKTLRVGTIDTWWDYEQLASRGVEPAFQFIESVGDRLNRLRMRLRDAMEAVQTSAIANQTEATRDNTFQLEVIAQGLSTVSAHLVVQQDAAEKTNRWLNFLYFLIGAVLGVISMFVTVILWLLGSK